MSLTLWRTLPICARWWVSAHTFVGHIMLRTLEANLLASPRGSPSLANQILCFWEPSVGSQWFFCFHHIFLKILQARVSSCARFMLRRHPAGNPVHCFLHTWGQRLQGHFSNRPRMAHNQDNTGEPSTPTSIPPVPREDEGSLFFRDAQPGTTDRQRGLSLCPDDWMCVQNSYTEWGGSVSVANINQTPLAFPSKSVNVQFGVYWCRTRRPFF